MRLVCWNVNGLRTLKGYQPWYQLPSWETCLEELGADIACFQEAKMTRKQLQYSMCVMDKYEGYFDLHPTKGYSGTATYVRKDICMPLAAARGITGQGAPLRVGRTEQDEIGYEAVDMKDALDKPLYDALDNEGRCVVLDCGLFVLINVYAPNETDTDRLDYKMAFYHVLDERVRALRRAGREVIVTGDLNVVSDPADHCEGAGFMSSAEGREEFFGHPARAWFKRFISASDGVLIDITRKRHPDQERMFTCWNTLIDARPANYGTRLDYTLISPGLEPWIKAADIQPQIHGSDHCPVFLELFDTIEQDGQTLSLVDQLHGLGGQSPVHTVPRLAASQLDEFCARKQPRLLSMFAAARAGTKEPEKPASEPPVSASPEGDCTPRDETGSESPLFLSQESEGTPGTQPEDRQPKKPLPPPPRPKDKQRSRSAPQGRQQSLASFFSRPAPQPTAEHEPQPVDKRPASLLDPEAAAAENPAKAARTKATTEQWSSIFTPHPPPLCTVHKEPARSWTVNKPGINHGRKFWLCSRPVGPGYEGSKVPYKQRDARSAEYRCNFFAWDSDVKRDAKRRAASNSAPANGSGL